MNKNLIQTILLAAVVLSLVGSVAHAAEGDTLWQKNSLGDNLESAPAVDSSGNVYVICSGTVYSYTSGGTFRWSTATSYGDACNPSVSPDNTVVYTCGTGGVYALNASNGNEIWHQPTGVYATVPCVSPDGTRIYIGEGHESSPSNNFRCLDASDGSIEWTYVENGSPTQGIRGFMGGASVDSDGTIYAPSQHGYLVSLTDNGTSYAQNWKFSFGAEARQPVTVSDDGYVYATCNTGVVHKINKTTGNEDTSGSWPALGSVGEVFASMCFSPDGNTLYVNGEDSKLHALNSDGSEKWSYAFQTWGSDPLVRDDGKIIVMGQVSGSGRVCCLTDNGSSATLEWTSDPICSNLNLNETNVNIAPNGTIYVHSGDESPLALFAIEGNGYGLSTTSPNPKYMVNIQNNGIFGEATPDTDPPTPDPMTWASVPTADDQDSISMTATTATDVSGVEYYFDETTGGPGGTDSGWQDPASYTDAGLNAATQYCYEVTARDKSTNQNETAASSNQCATTDAPDTTPPTPDPMTWATLPHATGSSAIAMTATTASDPSGVQYFFNETSGNPGGSDSGWQSSPSYTDTGLDPLTQYTYTVKARDVSPNYNETAVSTAESATTEAAPAEVSIIGSWTSGTSHTAESGSARALIFTAHAEDNDTAMSASVTYGGQSMTKVAEYNEGTGYRAYAAAFILDEAGIVAAGGSSTFNVTWAQSPSRTPGYSSVFLEGVDQTTPVGASDGNGGTTATVTTSALATGEGDMVVLAGSCGATGTYSTNNGFTEAIELTVESGDGVAGYKAATGANETPSITHSAANRQAIVGLVVQSGGAAPPDTTPPTPDPMTWATTPYSTGQTSIAMTATTASDASGVEYYFMETSANPGGSDSGWQDSTSYTDTGLNAGTQYCYEVQARDKSVNQNLTGWSTNQCATTDTPDTTPPTPDPMTWATVPYATGSSSIAMTATTATDPSGVQYYFDETSGNPGGSDSGWQASTSYTDTGLSASTQYTYTVTARDQSVNLNETAASTAESATTQAGGGPVPIPLTNASFETPTGTTTNWNNIPGWDSTSDNWIEPVSAYDGSQAAFSGELAGAYISQTTTETIEAGRTYTLTFYSNSELSSGDAVRARMVYGSTVIVSQDYGVTQSWAQKTLSFNSDDYPSSIGQTLAIELRRASGTEVRIDYVSLEYTGGTPDTDPPTPNPATFASPPSADSDTAISMTATTGSDPSGPVEYYFDETSGNPGGSDSGWQTSTNYTDTGLTASTQYTYTVQMRDSIPNTGTASSPANATTDPPPDTTPPSPDPMTWASVPSADSDTAISMTATTASDPSGVEYYFMETSANPGGSDSGWQDSTSYTDTGLSELTQYCYEVQARDKSANQNATAWSTNECATTQATPDTTPPAPDPMTWNSAPAAGGTDNISMTAATASDPSGVEYSFDETSGNPGGTDSGWQDSASYTDTGLNDSTQYCYRVQARDKSVNQNATAYSSTQCATTDAIPDTDPPTPNPATWASVPSADSSSAISMTATTGSDASGPVQYYFDETSGNPGGSDSGWQTSVNYTDTGLDADTQYTYTVQMRDSIPNTGTASSPANATTDPASGWTQIIYDEFESGFGNWNDGGSDCSLYTSGTRAHQGNNAIDIQDNSTPPASTTYTDNLALAAYDEVKVDFWYYCYSMDNSNEDFWLQISTDGGSNWTTVEEWNLGDEFVNEQFYPDSVIITGYTLTNNTQLRFRCHASGNADDVYIDEVMVSAQGGGAPDTDPPTPNPATWSSVPSADSSSAISMTATTGSDPSGVQYEFDETSGNPGGSDSGWQSSSSYTDSGLNASTQYCYRVRMRDQSANQNTGSWSTTECATTQAGGGPTPITIDNYSFEQPGGPGDRIEDFGSVPYWDSSATESGITTVDGASDGSWATYQTGGDPWVYQVTGHTIAAESYELKIDAKDCEGGAPDVDVELYYGSTTLASQTFSITQSWAEKTLSHTVNPGDPAIGQQLGVRFRNPSGSAWVNVDNVRLTRQ